MCFQNSISKIYIWHLLKADSLFQVALWFYLYNIEYNSFQVPAPQARQLKTSYKSRTTNTSKSAGKIHTPNLAKRPEDSGYVPTVKQEVKVERQSYPDKQASNVGNNSSEKLIYKRFKVEGEQSVTGLPSKVRWALSYGSESTPHGRSTLVAYPVPVDSNDANDPQGDSSLVEFHLPDSPDENYDPLPQVPIPETLLPKHEQNGPTPSNSTPTTLPGTNLPKPSKKKQSKRVICPCCEAKLYYDSELQTEDSVLQSHLVEVHKMKEKYSVKFVLRRRLIERIIASRGPLLCSMCRYSMDDNEMMKCFERFAPGRICFFFFVLVSLLHGGIQNHEPFHQICSG